VKVDTAAVVAEADIVVEAVEAVDTAAEAAEAATAVVAEAVDTVAATTVVDTAAAMTVEVVRTTAKSPIDFFKKRPGVIPGCFLFAGKSRD
jgi:hypothetical protein